MHLKVLTLCVLLAAFVAIVYGEELVETNDINGAIKDEAFEEMLMKEFRKELGAKMSQKREPQALCAVGKPSEYCFGWKRDEGKRDPEQWKKNKGLLKGLNIYDNWKRSVRRRSVSDDE
ncbi:uncharacterized protein LOC144441093 [Glandiceps talaboti]